MRLIGSVCDGWGSDGEIIKVISMALFGVDGNGGAMSWGTTAWSTWVTSDIFVVYAT